MYQNLFNLSTVNADVAEIENLTSSSATISTLTSTSATIGSLTSTSATIGSLTSTSASIASLTSTTANITNCNATNLYSTNASLYSCSITSATNQLTLLNTTISCPAKASPSTYYIPESGTSAEFLMTSGAQNISGLKTNYEPLTVETKHASNYLLSLGKYNDGSKMIHIRAPTMTSSIEYTLPHVGSVAEFLMSAGGQTISGTKTFSANPVISAISKSGQTITVPATTGTMALLSDIANMCTTDTNQNISGIKTNYQPLTVETKHASNYLLSLGKYNDGGKYFHIKAPTMTSSVEYTIPHVGEVAYFLMSAGAQTITGTKTFSARPNIYSIGRNGSVITVPELTGTIALTSQIPDTTNFVTTNTDQTISAVKTFSNTTASTSKATGGVIMGGGLGVNKGVCCQSVNIFGADSLGSSYLWFTANSTAESKGESTGSIIATEDVGVKSLRMSAAGLNTINIKSDGDTLYEGTGLNKFTSSLACNAGADSDGQSHYRLRTGDVDRYIMGMYEAENGTDQVGSNFALWKYNNAGVYLGSVFSHNRLTDTVVFESTNDSTSTSTGSVVISGGLGLAKKLYTGDTTQSTTTTTGGSIMSGGLGVAKNITMGGVFNTANCNIRGSQLLWYIAASTTKTLTITFAGTSFWTFGGNIRLTGWSQYNPRYHTSKTFYCAASYYNTVFAHEEEKRGYANSAFYEIPDLVYASDTATSITYNMTTDANSEFQCWVTSVDLDYTSDLGGGTNCPAPTVVIA